ncbi:MAG: insulinase family protein [Chitinophagaceae bacterium]|nr:insulinase family protein [Chitinophagaceae bacterium]
MTKRFLLLGSILVFLFTTATSQTPPAGKTLSPDPKVKIGKLANGMTYYIRKNTEPKNRAELRLVVRAGSILENEQQLGLAHFAEHMAFNGTKNFKKQELVDFLEKSGVNFGADLNAYTSFDETVYELQLPTDSAEVFKKGFQILEDWAHNVSFENEEIDKERGVVIEEWRLGQGADERMRVKYFPVLLKGSQYAKRLPIGTKQNLENFKYETLKQFYKDWYRPDLQAVVVVGDFDVAQVEKMIKEHFGRIPKAVNPKPRTKFGIPAHKETGIAIATDPEQQYNIVQIFYKQPSIPEPKTDVQYRAMLVRELFNTMISQRLDEKVQSGEAPFVFASSNYSKLIGDKDALILMAVMQDPAMTTDAIEILLEENERVKRFGFTKGELERAKANMLSQIESSYNERDKTRSAAYVNEYVRHFLDNEPIPGIEKEYDIYKTYMPGITLKEVNALISQWIKPTDRAVVIMGPEDAKDKLPTEKDVASMMNMTFKDLFAYEDKTVNEPLLSKVPTAGQVTNMKVIPELGNTVELELSNGATVVLKQTDFKNDEIVISAISKGGTSLVPDEQHLSGTNASFVVMFGGVGNFDYMSLQKALAGKNLYVAPSIGTYTEGLSGSATPKDLETAMQLIHLYFTSPRMDEASFKVVQQQLTASLANKGKDPSSVFMDTVSYVMGNYHPRRKPMTLESLKEIDYNTAYNIYKQRFANAGDFIFTFVGNFNPQQILPLIQKYIASLPAAEQKENWKDLGIDYPQGLVERVVKKGQEDKASVRMFFTGNTTYSDLEEVQLDQLTKILGIRLREVLREDQGGVYGVGVRGSISRVPDNSYSVSINFSCAPANVDKLIALVMAEIDNLKANGASQTNIDKVTAEDTRTLETQLRQNSYWQYNLEQKYLYGEDPKLILEDMNNLKKLTVERTKELANKYLNNQNFAKMILLPEKQ